MSGVGFFCVSAFLETNAWKLRLPELGKRWEKIILHWEEKRQKRFIGCETNGWWIFSPGSHLEGEFMVRRVMRVTLGSLLILLGLAGLVLPVLQGWLFLGLGTVVLSKDVSFFARVTDWIAKRFPRVGLTVHRLRKTLPVIGD